MNFKYSLW